MVQIRLSNLYFFKYEHLNVLFEKMIMFSPISGRLGIGKFSEMAVIGAFYRCAMAEKRIRQHMIFSSFSKMTIYYFTPETLRLSPFSTKCWSTLMHICRRQLLPASWEMCPILNLLPVWKKFIVYSRKTFEIYLFEEQIL